MKCNNCNFYKSGYMWNQCSLLEYEYFHIQKDCAFVNDDQTINEPEMERIFGPSVGEGGIIDGKTNLPML